MSSAADIRAGNAYVEFGAKDKGFSKGLKKMQKRMEAWGKAMRETGTKVFGAGAAVVTPLAGAAAAYGEMGAHAERTSQKTGLSVEATSTLGYAAKESGVDADAFAESVEKMNKTIGEAADGSVEAKQALAQLGLTVDDLKGKSTEDRFKLIANGLNKIQDPAMQGDLAIKLMSKSGAEMLPLMLRGADGISALQQKARDLGLEMKGEDAKAALEFSDKLDDLWQTLEMLAFKVGSAVAPMLQKFVDITTRLTTLTIGWINQHRLLITMIFAGAAAFAAAGAAMIGLGAAISAAGVAMGALATVVGLVGAAIGAILSPIGLIVTGISAAAAAFLYFSGVGATVGNSVIGAFKAIWQSIQFVFQNTSTGSQAWAAALTEAAFLVQQAWAAVRGSLKVLWDGIKGDAVQMWDSLADAIIDSATLASKVFSDIWAKTLALWEKAVGITAKTIRDVVAPPKGKSAGDDTEASISQFAAKHLAQHPKFLHFLDQLPGAGGIQQGTYDLLDKMQHPKPKSAQEKYEADAAKKDSDQIDNDLNARLAANKKDYEDKKKYLDQMQAQQHAGDAQATRDKRNADNAAAKKAKDDLAAAKKAYEDALKAKHDASGEKSLADQAKSIFGSITPATAPPPPGLDPTAIGNNLDHAMAPTSAAGTFNASAVAGMFGSGASDRHLNTIANQTTKASELLSSILSTFKGAQVIRHT